MQSKEMINFCSDVLLYTSLHLLRYYCYSVNMLRYRLRYIYKVSKIDMHIYFYNNTGSISEDVVMYAVKCQNKSLSFLYFKFYGRL